MLAKKASLSQTGAVELQALTGVLQPSDALDRAAELTAAAREEDGGALLVDEPACVMYDVSRRTRASTCATASARVDRDALSEFACILTIGGLSLGRSAVFCS